MGKYICIFLFIYKYFIMYIFLFFNLQIHISIHTHTQKHTHARTPSWVKELNIKVRGHVNRKSGNLFHAKRKRQAMCVVFLLEFIYRGWSVMYCG